MSKEEIQRCLNCELPECINCLEYENEELYEELRKTWVKYSDIDTTKFTKKQREFFEYYKQGYNDVEIANILGRVPQSITLMRHRAGIPPLPKYSLDGRKTFILHWMKT